MANKWLILKPNFSDVVQILCWVCFQKGILVENRKFLLMNEAFFPIKFKHTFEASVLISTHSCPDAMNSIDLFSFFFRDSIYTLVIGHVLQSRVALLITFLKTTTLRLLCREINICFTPLHSQVFGTWFALIFSHLFCIFPCFLCSFNVWYVDFCIKARWYFFKWIFFTDSLQLHSIMLLVFFGFDILTYSDMGYCI